MTNDSLIPREGGITDRRLTARIIFALTDPWNLYETFEELIEKRFEEAQKKGTTNCKRITIEDIRRNPSTLIFHFEGSGRQLAPEKVDELNSTYRLEDLLKGK